MPSSIDRPEPLAHHSREWNPLPENSTASRTGASLALPFASSPQTLSDSSQGRAMLTPTPRRNVRRGNWWVLAFIVGLGGFGVGLEGRAGRGPIDNASGASATTASRPRISRNWRLRTIGLDRRRRMRPPPATSRVISSSRGSSESCTPRPRA